MTEQEERKIMINRVSARQGGRDRRRADKREREGGREREKEKIKDEEAPKG